MKAKDINQIFKENPLLAEIGGKAQYKKYLKTIFPKSKIKNIVYHYAEKKIDKFSSNFIEGYAAQNGCPPKAIFFLDRFATKESFLSKRPHLGRFLINLENPGVFPKDKNRSDKRESGIKEWLWEVIESRNDGAIFDNIWDNQMWCNVYVVLSPNQIHILGSKKDNQKFKKFIKSKYKK